MKKISLIFAVFVLCISMVSCSAGISRDEADIIARDLLNKLAEDDIEGATEMMHPSTNTTVELFEAYIDALEKSECVNFGMLDEVKLLSNFSSAVYSSSVGGSYYEIQYRLVQGDLSFRCIIEIIKVDDIIGVSNIEISVE